MLYNNLIKKKEVNNIMAIISLIILSFTLGTCEFIVIGVLTDISASLNITEVQAGSLVSTFALFYSIFTPFSAAIAGKFNRYHFIILVSILFALSNLLCAFAANYIILIIDQV